MNSAETQQDVFGLWRPSVYVRIGRGNLEAIAGPNEALTYLANRWPAERGSYFENAKFACLMAVDHNG